MRLIIFCLLTSLSARSQTLPPLTRETCLQKIDSIFRSQTGIFALAFTELSTGRQLFIREHESFHAASTMKTPVMIEIYRQIEAGRLRLSDTLLLKNEFTSIADTSHYTLSPDDDSETELYRHPGEGRTISQLIYLMITASSNFATNLLVERAGPQNIAATLHQLGADEIHVLRGVEDEKAFEIGLNNTVTAAGLAIIFEKLAKGAAVSPAASEAMISILLDQHYNEIIPAGLPAGTRVAHKTGWIKGINHDSGIVFLPDGRKYVLVLLSKQTEDDRAAVAAMAEVSRIIYRYVTQ